MYYVSKNYIKYLLLNVHFYMKSKPLITGHVSIFFNGSTAPWRPRPPHFLRLHDHTQTPHTR